MMSAPPWTVALEDMDSEGSGTFRFNSDSFGVCLFWLYFLSFSTVSGPQVKRVSQAQSPLPALQESEITNTMSP